MNFPIIFPPQTEVSPITSKTLWRINSRSILSPPSFIGLPELSKITVLFKDAPFAKPSSRIFFASSSKPNVLQNAISFIKFSSDSIYL